MAVGQGHLGNLGLREKAQAMKKIYDLSGLEWRLAGFAPFTWCSIPAEGIGAAPSAEIPAIPAPVPGSVQMALRQVGLLPDWNVGLQARECEWVEHRHWVYEAALPDEWVQGGAAVRLRCLGLDGFGLIRLNGKEVGRFANAFVPHVFDLTPGLAATGNLLQIIFEFSPRWLGCGYTSKITEWKPRFNYTWDWVPRLVQIGIWDAIALEVTDGVELEGLVCTTDASRTPPAGILHVKGCGRGDVAAVYVSLTGGETIVREERVFAGDFVAGLTWTGLPVDLWWPHTHGPQPLYRLTCRLLDAQGNVVDEEVRQVGFRHIAWEPCEGAPRGADPWLCVVNGQRVFLQGVNWTPIRSNFADVTDQDVRQRLELYKDLGCNILRVWGGAVLERSNFYRACDELGILVWQEFPLSSSGLENWPPEDPTAIREMAAIAASYIQRRQHHACLAVWCGGNELQGGLDGSKTGGGKPVDATHPMIAQLKRVVEECDGGRRFLPTSSSGPRFVASEADYGKGLHWDVHGPWKAEGPLDPYWARYWRGDDALLRSETGSPGASPADLIRQYAGECEVMPASIANPLWRRTSWWIEWDRFIAERGREPATLDEYVAWSQGRQADALAIAVGAVKDRFPRAGGVILWMGHDCFPCTANTSIVDFHGRPKPAALAVGEIFNRPTADQ